MAKVGKGVPSPAKLKNIVEDLFENEKTKYPDGTSKIFTFSRVQLTNQQKNSLIVSYPPESTALNFYVINQFDDFDAEGHLTGTDLAVVSFVKKNDGFIYGSYFDIFNQQRFDINELTKSPKPIHLSDNAKLITSNYLEVYSDILKTTFILGLSTENE